MKPAIEKANKHGSYSEWDAVQKADESICGIYITYQDLITQIRNNNGKVKINFDITIGFDMFIPTQGFNLFPNCIFGDISAVIKLNPNALVWASTDPSQFIRKRFQMLAISGGNDDERAAIEDSMQTIRPLGFQHYYDHRFTQVRNLGLVRSSLMRDSLGTDAKVSAYMRTPLTIVPQALITNTAESTILGFSLKNEVKSALSSYYTSHPFVIPCESLEIDTFSTGPTSSGLNVSITVPLNNVKEILTLYPRSPNDLTVFRNPEYRDLTITLLNTNYPQKGANTISATHFRTTTECCNLDGLLTPTNSFTNSYLKSVSPFSPIRHRCSGDDTDYVFVTQLSRLSGNIFFSDAIKRASETIAIKGSPIHQGYGPPDSDADGSDTYFYLNREAERDSEFTHNYARPILVRVSDGCWLFAVGRPPVFEVGVDWSDVLSRHFG
jgi:hypothetical protein